MNDMYELGVPSPTPEHPERREFIGLYVFPDGGVDFHPAMMESLNEKVGRELEAVLGPVEEG